ncbi:hypothetical protein RIF29_18849 [Crotalaria pallida]|uniref:Uncharacterized protein n=1 Tax=Crotalaria pallida TaxID=3830 RepID=A0AAN9EYC0_CROPI
MLSHCSKPVTTLLQNCLKEKSKQELEKERQWKVLPSFPYPPSTFLYIASALKVQTLRQAFTNESTIYKLGWTKRIASDDTVKHPDSDAPTIANLLPPIRVLHPKEHSLRVTSHG